MNQPEVTPAQTTVLVRLHKHPEPSTAYELHTSLNTTEAMVKKGLLKKIVPKGVIWRGWERITYKYELTPLGRSMINGRR